MDVEWHGTVLSMTLRKGFHGPGIVLALLRVLVFYAAKFVFISIDSPELRGAVMNTTYTAHRIATLLQTFSLIYKMMNVMNEIISPF